MADIVRKQVCRCVNCGNEAEMVFTCSLPEETVAPAEPEFSAAQGEEPDKKVRAVGTCSHCGNEADMWIDL
jgi:ribosomal protein S14